MAQRTVRTIRSECGRIVVFIRYCNEWDEYRVALKVDGVLTPEATYYTDDSEDAKGTANLMLESALKTLQPALTLSPL
jgi:hypothetical protein